MKPRRLYKYKSIISYDTIQYKSRPYTLQKEYRYDYKKQGRIWFGFLSGAPLTFGILSYFVMHFHGFLTVKFSFEIEP